jgi:hypothetical protein
MECPRYQSLALSLGAHLSGIYGMQCERKRQDLSPYSLKLDSRQNLNPPENHSSTRLLQGRRRPTLPFSKDNR